MALWSSGVGGAELSEAVTLEIIRNLISCLCRTEHVQGAGRWKVEGRRSYPSPSLRKLNAYFDLGSLLSALSILKSEMIGYQRKVKATSWITNYNRINGEFLSCSWNNFHLISRQNCLYCFVYALAAQLVIPWDANIGFK